MGKTKFNRYKGVRKRRQSKPIPISMTAKDLLLAARARPTNTNDMDGAPSTSARKLEYFNLTLEEMIETKNQKKSDNSSDCFLFVHSISLNKLI